VIAVVLRDLRPRLPLLALLGVAAYFTEPGFHAHANEAPGEFTLDLGPFAMASTLALYAALGMIVLLGGFISADRREGYYRMALSHPTRPVALYALRWIVALVAVLVASALLLVVGQLVAWGRFEGGWRGLYLAAVSAFAYGGLVAVLSAGLRRGDTLVAVCVLFFNFFWMFAGAPPLPGVLGDAMPLLLPPQLALSDVYDGLLRGEVAWAASAFAAGYGVFWTGVAALRLRIRDWP
jgi:hypothetical protein